MARDKSAGFRLDMGEPWDGMLADFCGANYDANKTEVIRRALVRFIPTELARDGEKRQEFEKRQARRHQGPDNAKET